MIFFYSLITVNTVAGGGTAPVYPSGDTQGDCGIDTRSQQDLLDLFDRILPQSYIEPLKDGSRDGYELLQAYAQLWARISLAAERILCSAQYLSATDGVKATGTVQFFRDVAGPQVTIKKGTILEASGFGNTIFRTLQDATIALNDVGPVSAPAEAVFPGYDGNVLGEFTLSDGTVLPGAIDTFAMPFQDPALADPSIQVSQPSDFTGGTPPALDQLGADRGIDRQDGEEANRYRARIRSLPDTVSAPAIQRVITDLLQSLSRNLTFTFIECFNASYQTCYDAPAAANPGSSFDPSLFCFDDPRPPIPFRNRWLAESDHYGGFIVVLPMLPALRDFGMAYDDPATVPGDFQTNIGGVRAYAAYDIPDTFTLLAGSYDGYDAHLASLYVGVQALIERIKAGGTDGALEVQGD